MLTRRKKIKQMRESNWGEKTHTSHKRLFKRSSSIREYFCLFTGFFFSLFALVFHCVCMCVCVWRFSRIVWYEAQNCKINFCTILKGIFVSGANFQVNGRSRARLELMTVYYVVMLVFFLPPLPLTLSSPPAPYIAGVVHFG